MYGFGFGGALSGFLSAIFGRADSNEEKVRDLLALPGQPSVAVGINELAQEWSLYRKNVERMIPDMLGDTPMASALRTARQRIREELAAQKFAREPVLLIVSDGEPTPEDWAPDPVRTVQELAAQLKQEGVAIVTCLLTGGDIGEPRRLYAAPDADWPDGANLLFECASEVSPTSPFASLLREYHWTVDAGARLFAQINRSDVLNEFSKLVLSRLPASESAQKVTRAGMLENDWGSEGTRTAESSKNPVSVFISYSHQDEKYLGKGELLDYLAGLRQDGIDFWWDGRIETGDAWDDNIRRALSNADIAVALVSQAFLNSRYCQEVELRTFLERQKFKGLRVLPVIISPCDWQNHSWLSSRQVLPRSGTIGTHYSNRAKRQQLYLDLLNDIRRLAGEVRDKSAHT
jgi:hypothetical protein